MNEQKDQLTYYLTKEKRSLIAITISGIGYNVGMIAGPWFEGQLVQRLLDVISGRKTYQDMIYLVLYYVLVIALVQGARFLKRLYVRKFANHLNRDMKENLYDNLVHRSQKELQKDGCGNIMTKAISDVDTCVEGIRKFTTEVFDTGVVMVAYIVMLAVYDWRLTCLAMICPPIAYLVAERLKKVVTRYAYRYKESAGRLNEATMDRIRNAMTYRIYGQEARQNDRYEEALCDYEHSGVLGNIWETSMQPIYQIITSVSVIFILWLGGRNVLQMGWSSWNIAAFTTFLSCFMKLAVKSSKAAKLFNAVQKAKVSWERIRPYLAEQETVDTPEDAKETFALLRLSDVSFRYLNTPQYLLSHLNLQLLPGEILGVAGPIASGKSALGKLFLQEEPYEGSIRLEGRSVLVNEQLNNHVVYMGHHPQLLSTTIEENILLGEEGDVYPILDAVCMSKEISEMAEGIHTLVGNKGVRLSGGQQARIALARTLYHRGEIVVLDDPFASIDRKTEQEIMHNIKPWLRQRMVILISHRLELFTDFAQILWMEDQTIASHDKLMQSHPKYRSMYELQMGGDENA